MFLYHCFVLLPPLGIRFAKGADKGYFAANIKPPNFTDLNKLGFYFSNKTKVLEVTDYWKCLSVPVPSGLRGSLLSSWIFPHGHKTRMLWL